MPPFIEIEACTGCKRCYEACPLDVFGFDRERNIPMVLYPKECWHCGVCELECPEDLIDVKLPPQIRNSFDRMAMFVKPDT